MTEENRLTILELRISELETKIRALSLGRRAQVKFSAGSCTNQCLTMAPCTSGCSTGVGCGGQLEERELDDRGELS